uniref:Immune-associated nucleotide-binding protein 12-like n=1 Tax=Fundulus heteroclitus TaxID=8078 RepID=A0A3Q2PYG5_FUNHE
MASLSGSKPTQSQLVLLLLGERESGKSSAGDAILSRRAFDRKTTRSCRRAATVFGLQVSVVDTPGWLSPSTTPHTVSEELVRALSLCHPGPDAILLVLPTTSMFCQEEWRAMEAQLRLLGAPIWKRAIVLFTHGDKLGALPVQEHIRQQGGTLRWLLERCGNRYQVMSSTSRTARLHVRELFQKIRRMAELSEHIREIHCRVSAQLGDLSMREEQRRNGRPQEIEMTVMVNVYGSRPGRREASGSGRRRGVAGGADGLKPALTLILLGRRKSGKSSAGNMILQREEFRRDAKTTRCAAGHAEISGRSVTVVDTPGWSLFGRANPEQVRREMRQSPSLSPAGSKVTFLLAVPVDSFAEKDRKAVETYLTVLGDGVWRSTAVLFTYGDALEGRTIERFIEKKGQPLQWVLDMCDHRHHVCDTNTDDTAEVEQLLEMVERS